MNYPTKTISIGDQDLVLESGRFAQQAGAAVTARYGDTMVLATAVMGRANENLGYFPLSVEYQENLYAGGKIKGSRWVKRPGRPSDDAILSARLIDRTIRPLFPDGMINEVQVVVMVLSADGENDADMPAMCAVSTALAASNIPWNGPISGVRVGLNQESGELLINPGYEARETSDLDLVLTGTKEAVVMVEAGANEVPESKMLEAFALAEKENSRVSTEIEAFAKEIGKKKSEVVTKLVNPEAIDAVKKEVAGDLENMVKAMANLEPSGKDDMVLALAEKHEEYSKSTISDALSELLKKETRRQTLEDNTRPDGRAFDEVRQLESEVGILPRTHGSAMFKRGATQALTVATLGSPSLNQLIENMEGEESKRYIHHYSMPPYSVGETGRVGWPSRREVGHGALAERALLPVIPEETEFPYTIHVVSELMSSNGSTSMASVCGSTMSLMDAGVPIKKPVAGIAMGLLIQDDKHVVLSDIQGLEDHTGDMDFKVAGTKDGITAMQMDIKVSGISGEILAQALEQAKKGRLHILEHMTSTLAQPRQQLSQYAPKIITINIPVDRIGEIIGPGGKIIKGIIEDTGADISVEDDGRVFISSVDQEGMQKAKDMIEGILREVEAGEEFDGTVVRITDFGAFVQILPNRDGLVHVSNMSTQYVSDPNNVVSVGDKVHVRVIKVDDLGRIDLTMLTPDQEAEAKRGSGGSGGRLRGSGGQRKGGQPRGGKPSGRNNRRAGGSPNRNDRDSKRRIEFR